jgi:chemotaxis protein CheD
VSRKILVRIAEFKVASNPNILECIGIGSCVAICLWDRVKKIGGLAHILLGENKNKNQADVNPLRFANEATDAMLREMLGRGCRRENIRAKIFGGASMFRGLVGELQIGEKNVAAVREKLRREGIRIVAEDVGGDQARSIWFDLSDGSVVVGRLRGPTKEM